MGSLQTGQTKTDSELEVANLQTETTINYQRKADKATIKNQNIQKAVVFAEASLNNRKVLLEEP